MLKVTLLVQAAILKLPWRRDKFTQMFKQAAEEQTKLA